MTDATALPRRILVTGAAGSLGGHVARHLVAALTAGQIHQLRLADLRPVPDEIVADLPPHLRGALACIEGSLADRDAAFAATEGMQAIVHLAGIPFEDEWQALIPANLATTAHLFDAAVTHGVDRILFASSNHAVGLYPTEQRIDHLAPPLADSRYGLTKAFGEQLAALYAAKTPLKAFCMRIGSCFPQVTQARQMHTFQSFADFLRLVDVGLSAEYRFEVVYGLSAIADSYWDNGNARRLGYEPQHRPSDFIRAPLDPVEHRFQGGSLATMALPGLETDQKS